MPVLVHKSFGLHLLTKVVLLLLAIVCWSNPGTAAAQATDSVQVEIKNVDWGFGGYHKLGQWSPLAAQIEVSGAAQLQMVIESIDPDGATTSIPTSLLKIEGSGSHRLTGIFKNGRIGGLLRVSIRDENQRTLASWSAPRETFDPTVLRLRSTLIATVGECPLFSDQPTETPIPPSIANELVDSLQVVSVPDFESLPTDDMAYDTLDVLVVTANYSIPESQNTALKEWVRRGGKLILSVGQGLEEYQKSLLPSWVPIPITAAGSTRELAGLEQYVDQQTPIRFRQGLRTVPIANIGEFDGQVLAKSRSGPILVRNNWGLGEVTLLGVDTNQPPLSEWQDLRTLGYLMLWGKQTSASEAEKNKRSQLVHSGITDFQTQIRASQENFPDIKRMPTWGVMVWVLGYMLLIGPIDYLIVRRLLRKPHLTWITFPIVVIASVGLAVQTASTTNARTLVLNQLDLIDIDTTSETGILRSQSWATLYSPETRRYKVSAKATPVSTKQTVAPSSAQRVFWQGIPEETFGGMYRAGGFSLGRSTYRLSEDAMAIENLPISIWSTQNLESHWQTDQSKLVTSQLVSSGFGRLEGPIVHNFKAPIKNWMIAFGTQVYSPRDADASRNIQEILPGKPLVLSPGTPGLMRRQLRNYLTGVTRARVEREDNRGDEIVSQETAYNALSRDPEQILRVLSFYKIAGGETYSGLKNHSMRTHDLSHLVDTDKAVLFGQIDTPSIEYQVDGEVVSNTRQKSFVRIVLPVEIKNK